MAKRKKPALIIRDYETHGEVRRVEVSSIAPRYVENILRSLLRKIDSEKLYVDESEVEVARAESKGSAPRRLKP